MDKKHIRYKQFLRALTCQDFFIWHDLPKDKTHQDQSEPKEDLQAFWEEVEMGQTEPSASEIISKTFFKFNEYLQNLLTKVKGTWIMIQGQTVEEKILNTRKNLGKNKVLIHPVFEHKNSVSTPFAFDNKNKVIINLKYSCTTKRKDFLKAYYDFSVITPNTKVNDYHLYLPKNKDYSKNEIDLVYTNKIHPQKKGYVPGFCNAQGKEKNVPVLETIRKGCVTSKIAFPEFGQVVEKIEKAQNTKTPSFGEIKYDCRPHWEANPRWNELLEYLNNEFAWVNNKVISKKGIYQKKAETSSPVWKAISGSESAYINKDQEENLVKIMNSVKNAKKVVWYDFEGFSLPVPVLDGVLPYRQVVFQVSKIETYNNKEIYKENLVVDPLSLGVDDLHKIIETVYSNKAQRYVVYNKTYENTRINEMVVLLQKANHPRLNEAAKMAKHIIQNTVDLYKAFEINSRDKKPMVILHDQKGRTSIKNVEKHIHANKIKLKRPIVPYEDLEVQNGLAAMEVAIKRALDIIGTKEWQNKTQELQKYCENDVRAMIMVYDFIGYLLKTTPE